MRLYSHSFVSMTTLFPKLPCSYASAVVWFQVVENQSLRDSFLSGSPCHIVSHIVGSYRNTNLFECKVKWVGGSTDGVF